MTLQEIKEKYCVDAKNGEVTGFVTLRMANDGGFPQSLNFQIPGTKTWDKKKFISYVKTAIQSSIELSEPKPTIGQVGSNWTARIRNKNGSIVVSVPGTTINTPKSNVLSKLKNMLNKADWSVVVK